MTDENVYYLNEYHRKQDATEQKLEFLEDVIHERALELSEKTGKSYEECIEEAENLVLWELKTGELNND